MKLNQTIIRFVSILTNGGKISGRYLSFSDKSMSLKINESILIEIGEEPILLFGKEDLGKKIIQIPEEKDTSTIAFDKLEEFCQAIGILRLNHLGISYPCNIKEELETYKKLITNTSFKLYEEKSDNPNYRWFFIGNNESWGNPLFELVLNKYKVSFLKDWIPHFQIDVDTDKTIEELKELSEKYLVKDFFKWELNIPKQGVVLGMGRLGNIYGTKIYLGVGTKLRDVKYHRKFGMKEI